MIYIVTAAGVGGSGFVYRVTGPAGASDIEVACEAYGQHGIRLGTGAETEALGPQYTVERTGS